MAATRPVMAAPHRCRAPGGGLAPGAPHRNRHGAPAGLPPAQERRRRRRGLAPAAAPTHRRDSPALPHPGRHRHPRFRRACSPPGLAHRQDRPPLQARMGRAHRAAPRHPQLRRRLPHHLHPRTQGPPPGRPGRPIRSGPPAQYLRIPRRGPYTRPPQLPLRPAHPAGRHGQPQPRLRRDRAQPRPRPLGRHEEGDAAPATPRPRVRRPPRSPLHPRRLRSRLPAQVRDLHLGHIPAVSGRLRPKRRRTSVDGPRARRHHNPHRRGIDARPHGLPRVHRRQAPPPSRQAGTLEVARPPLHRRRGRRRARAARVRPRLLARQGAPRRCRSGHSLDGRPQLRIRLRARRRRNRGLLGAPRRPGRAPPPASSPRWPSA